jgi:hypothetical protein
MTFFSKRRAALAVAAAALLATSCSEIEPVIPVEGRRMVIIPMRDELHFHYDSEIGTRLAHLVTDTLEAKHKEDSDCVDVVPYEHLIAALRDVDPRDLSFADVGRRTKADLVLVGNVSRFETHLKGDIGFTRGAAKVDLVILETAHPERPLLRTSVSATFPPENYSQWGGFSGDEGGENEVREGLVALLRQRIAELFYAHEPEEKH